MTTKTMPLTLIRSDVWKKERTKVANRIRRGLHVQETNPGPESRLRYDYVVTSAEVTRLVEEVMCHTERLCRYAIQKEEAERKVRACHP